MRMLVAGGAGFLGSHLCDSFLKRGDSVICVDNLSTGSKNHISSFLSNDRFTFIEHDICKPLAIEGEIDSILNMASIASPPLFEEKSLEILKTNSQGHMHMLELARQKDAVILYASSSECYGDAQVHPQTETYWGNVNPTGIRSCYDEGKRFGEAISSAYQRKYGLNVKIARIFNTYGPSMHVNDGRVIPSFIRAALTDQPLHVFGTGIQTRSFCYVDDLIKGLLSLLLSKEKRPVNIGNDQEITIHRLAEIIIDLTGSKSPITFKPLPEDDPLRRKPDISRANAILSWKPKVGLQDGLNFTISYFKHCFEKNLVQTNSF